MASRLESPSSINTFRQCKRKYYYQYIEKLPTKGSIHLVRGNIVHSTLENFYDLSLEGVNPENCMQSFKLMLQKEFVKQWGEYKDKLSELNMSKNELAFYFEESLMMVLNWSDHFIDEFSLELKNGLSVQEAFKKLTPIREEEYKSEKHMVRGFIDAIQERDGEIHIIDYKTNKKSEIKDSIQLQLAIYTLLYHEKHGKIPEKVGVFFVRDKLKMLETNMAMVERAKRDIIAVHQHTTRTDNKFDYHRNVTPLCKWKTGQCDFFDVCKPLNN